MPTIANWLRLFESHRRDIQFRAARALLDRSDEVPLRVLTRILDDPSMEGLGAKVERALLRRTGPELRSAMVARLLTASDPFVREASATVLGHSGATTAAPHLLAALRDPHVMLRRAAAFALALLEDASSEPELTRVYSLSVDDDINVRMALECALDALGASYVKHPR